MIGLLARCLTLTYRTRVILCPQLQNLPENRDILWVYVLWHGQILPLVAHRRPRTTVALVSQSRDGQLLVWAMRWFGVRAERGSSSHRGVSGARMMIKRLKNGFDAAVAVDGPKGPRAVAQPGALTMARFGGAWVVPYAAACSRVVRLRSWDQFQVPMPFCRCVIVLGTPITDPLVCSTSELGSRINEAQKIATQCLREPGFSPFDKALL